MSSSTVVRVWRRISNRDRLSYAMNIAFGLCLVLAMVANILGYSLYEGNWGVRVTEIIVGLGLIALGIVGIRGIRGRRR